MGVGSQTFMNFPAGHSPLHTVSQGGWLPEAPPWEAAADPDSSRDHALLSR